VVRNWAAGPRDRIATRSAVANGRHTTVNTAAANGNDLALRQKVENLINELRHRVGANQFETFATKTEAFLQTIVQGHCELRPGISTVTPTGVIFTDETSADVDAIVFCTGYEASTAPFLKVQLDLARLYRNCFTSAYRETLAFLGFVRPPLGAIPPIAEMQARWLAQILSGHLRLPSKDQMDADTERQISKRNIYFHKVFNRLPHLVDFTTYMDDLAEQIGCKPSFFNLMFRPRVLYKVYTSAFSSVQFRLRGPHAQREMAERVLLHSPSYVAIEHVCDLLCAKAASLVGLKQFQPRLSLFGQRRSVMDYVE
jgi:hypothetical protein